MTKSKATITFATFTLFHFHTLYYITQRTCIEWAQFPLLVGIWNTWLVGFMINCKSTYLQVCVDMRMPVLLVRDGDSGASTGVNQGSFSRHEVVHGTNSVLDCNLVCVQWSSPSSSSNFVANSTIRFSLIGCFVGNPCWMFLQLNIWKEKAGFFEVGLWLCLMHFAFFRRKKKKRISPYLWCPWNYEAGIIWSEIS